MITILSKFLIKKDVTEMERRGLLGMICGIAGIILNIILFGIKLLAGIISNSIAITADAFNNLSDAGSSVITLIGFKLASKKPDPDHPFGHGRMEYLTGLVVAALIIIMGYSLIRDSIEKIIHPEETVWSLLVIGILLVSILGKLYMAYYNTRVGNEIESEAIKAVATDSLSDCISTGIVFLAMLVGHFTSFKIDGICGLFVGGLIVLSGINAAKEIINPLLGEAPEREFVEKIERTVVDYDDSILAIHDLVVHDYGPGRRMISLHAEVPAEGDILELHDIIDNVEKLLRDELGCEATIHMDPVVTKDPIVQATKEKVIKVVKGIDEVLTIHDFRMVEGKTHTNLIFDVLAPFDYKLNDSELKKEIFKGVQEQIGKQFFIVVEVDHDFVNRE